MGVCRAPTGLYYGGLCLSHVRTRARIRGVISISSHLANYSLHALPAILLPSHVITETCAVENP